MAEVAVQLRMESILQIRIQSAFDQVKQSAENYHLNVERDIN